MAERLPSVVFRQWLPLALAGLLCAIAAIVLVVARGNVTTQVALETAARDRAVSMERVRTALLDAETGQRGYLLTSDPDYLEPFERSVTSIDAVFEDAFRQSRAQSTEYARVEERLRALIDDKVSELRETIALHDAGRPEEALALVRTGRGKNDMDQIRSILDVVIAEDFERRNEAQAAKDFWRNRVSNTFMTILALMGVMLVWAIGNASRARRTALAERSLALSEEARDRIELLAGELDHRMKNIFAVMSGMIRQTSRAKSEDVRDYALALDGRLQSLGQAYYMTRELGEARTMSSEALLDAVVRAQLLDDNALTINGPTLTVHERAVTPVALILHEFTTNALKYGAWRPAPRGQSVNDNDDGRAIDTGVGVTLEDTGGDVVLTWSERAPGPVSAAGETGDGAGFGSRLIKGCAAQLGGTIEREWQDDGLTFRLRVPRERVLAA